MRGARPWVASHVLASGTAGGDLAAGAWVVRPLNTLVGNDSVDVLLAANQGSWAFDARVQGFRLKRFQARLYNVTAGAAALYGTSETADSGNNRSATWSLIKGEVPSPSPRPFASSSRPRSSTSSTAWAWPSALAATIFCQVTVRQVW